MNILVCDDDKEIVEAIETGDQRKIDAAVQAHYDIIHK